MQMASNALEKLTFTILLLDKVSQPAQGVCKSIQKVQQITQGAFRNISKGTASIAGTAMLFHSFSGPAREFEKALGEVASLDVAPEELDQLSKASKQFAMQFGGDATAIARSAYDIQSAIPGLAKGALAAFTVQGSLLAKATKADAATITKFQGTMYNIFEKSANQIGQAKWVEMLTGKTAHAVKIFKTTGNDMTAAFTNLGSIGEKAGVSLDEQLAVLGTLQGTMGGANAGTAYKAFLNTVGRAKLTTKNGETLKFTDESGKLLPMVKILEKIRAAVGPGQLKLADQTKLMQAFGDEGGKAVLNLLDKTESLKGSIGQLNKIQDAGGAVKMAKAMTDPYDQFAAILKVLRISLGQGILPYLNSALKVFSKFLGGVNWIVDTIPGLKYALGGIAMLLASVAIAFGSLFVMRGIISFLRVIKFEFTAIRHWIIMTTGATNGLTMAQRLNMLAQMGWAKTVAAANAALGFLQKKLLLSVAGLKIYTVWTLLSEKAQWLWTAITKKGAFAAALQTVWTKTLALCNMQLVFSTNAVSGATLKQSLTASLAAAKIIFLKGVMIAWKIVTWTCHAALVATKAVLLLGAIPAAIAWASTLAIVKGAALVLSGVMWLLTAGIGAAAASAWTFAAALWATGIPEIVLAIAALIAGVVLVYRNFDKLNSILPGLGDGLLMMLGPIGWIAELIKNWDNLPGIFTRMGEGIRTVYNWLAGKLVPVFDKVRQFFAWSGKWISKIPGLGFLNPDVTAGTGTQEINKVIKTAEETDRAAAPVVQNIIADNGTDSAFSDVIAARRRNDSDIPAGGVRSSSKVNHWGGVNIFAPNGMGPGQLEEWALLQG